MRDAFCVCILLFCFHFDVLFGIRLACGVFGVEIFAGVDLLCVFSLVFAVQRLHVFVFCLLGSDSPCQFPVLISPLLRFLLFSLSCKNPPSKPYNCFFVAFFIFFVVYVIWVRLTTFVFPFGLFVSELVLGDFLID